MSNVNVDRMITPAEAAEILHISARTLERWRQDGVNLHHHYKIGTRVFYSLLEVAEYMESSKRDTTSE